MAVITARKSRLQDWVSKGNRRAKVALELALAPNRFLSAVQVGITLVGILAGAFAGRSVAQWLAAHIVGIPVIGAYHQEVGLGFVVLTITYFSLVVGELVPKRLALRHPEAIATFVARPLRLFTRLSSPMVHLLGLSTDVVGRLFGKPHGGEPPVTEEEIKTLVQQGTDAGVFEESEQDMVEAVLRLGDKTARSLMTPRTQIAWLDLEDSAERVREKIISSGHSCFPVATDSLDKVDGVVQAKDLLTHSLAGHVLDLKSLMQQPLFVPRTVTALGLSGRIKVQGQGGGQPSTTGQSQGGMQQPSAQPGTSGQAPGGQQGTTGQGAPAQNQSTSGQGQGQSGAQPNAQQNTPGQSAPQNRSTSGQGGGDQQPNANMQPGQTNQGSAPSTSGQGQGGPHLPQVVIAFQHLLEGGQATIHEPAIGPVRALQPFGAALGAEVHLLLEEGELAQIAGGPLLGRFPRHRSDSR